MKKNIAVMFGGISAEHEVSVITGLQVLEKIDYAKFEVYAVYLNKDGLFYYYPLLTHRSLFQKIKPILCSFGRDKTGAYIREDNWRGKKHLIDGAYLAFHGGNGEDGSVQGMLEVLGIAHTSADHEGSVVAMNKNLMKQVLREKQIPCVKSTGIFAEQFRTDKDNVIKEILEGVGLPVIIKPAHLGSSIGINIAKDEAALIANLPAAVLVDNEILVEKLLEDFTEYNVSVRKFRGKIECSEIERPKKQDEILSFADKYEREGGKKQNATQGGMAGLARELPAKISEELRQKVISLAMRVFEECRLGGTARIDMLYENATGELYVNEINPIPGSVAFYLWEASGIQFQEQITQSIERAFEAKDEREAYRLEYETNIVEKFVNQ